MPLLSVSLYDRKGFAHVFFRDGSVDFASMSSLISLQNALDEGIYHSEHINSGINITLCEFYRLFITKRTCAIIHQHYFERKHNEEEPFSFAGFVSDISDAFLQLREHAVSRYRYFGVYI